MRSERGRRPRRPAEVRAAEGGGGVKTPPYDAKDKRVATARACPAPTEYGNVGCRAACPQAAGEVGGNEKPYGLPL